MSDTLAPRRDLLGPCGRPRWVARLVERCKALKRSLFDTYRPELHYMRGPGPKWREKHQMRRVGEQGASAADAVEPGPTGSRMAR